MPLLNPITSNPYTVAEIQALNITTLSTSQIGSLSAIQVGALTSSQVGADVSMIFRTVYLS